MNELEKEKENRFTIFTLDSTTYACHVCPCQDYSPRCTSIRTTGDPSAVDYSSITFVFPAEACETVGGEACDAEMYAEVKIKPETRSNRTRTSSEAVERDYFKYNEPKTVFPAEACDDLGGEFCELNYSSIRRQFTKNSDLQLQINKGKVEIVNQTFWFVSGNGKSSYRLLSRIKKF